VWYIVKYRSTEQNTILIQQKCIIITIVTVIIIIFIS